MTHSSTYCQASSELQQSLSNNVATFLPLIENIVVKAVTLCIPTHQLAQEMPAIQQHSHHSWTRWAER